MKTHLIEGFLNSRLLRALRVPAKLMVEQKARSGPMPPLRNTAESRARNLIHDICAKEFVSFSQITGPSRAENVVRARDKCVLALKNTGMSYPAIGRLLNRDHSTIVRSLQREKERLRYISPEDQAALKRIMSKTKETPQGCLIWKGFTVRKENRKPYGTASHQGKLWSVHRLVYALTEGEIPKDVVIRRTCDNPLCCRFEHMEPFFRRPRGAKS